MKLQSWKLLLHIWVHLNVNDDRIHRLSTTIYIDSNAIKHHLPLSSSSNRSKCSRSGCRNNFRSLRICCLAWGWMSLSSRSFTWIWKTKWHSQYPNETQKHPNKNSTKAYQSHITYLQVIQLTKGELGNINVTFHLLCLPSNRPFSWLLFFPKASRKDEWG